MERGTYTFSLLIAKWSTYTGLCVLLLIFNWLSWLELPKIPLQWALREGARFQEQIRLAFYQPVAIVQYWYSGAQKISEYENRLTKATVETQRLAVLESEVAGLTKAMGLKMAGENGKKIAALVISRAKADILVQAGEADLVTRGMYAIDEGGALVGRVTQVNPYFSRVELPSAVDTRIGVKIQGRDTQGVLFGDGSRALLTEVLQNETVMTGDVVVTLGTEGLFPAGLVVGQVAEIYSKAADITQQAQVTLSGRPEHLVILRDAL